MKKIIILLCVLLIAATVTILAVLSRPRQIQRTFLGAEIAVTGEGDYEFLRHINIHIDGQLRHGPLRRSTSFVGLFEIEEYSYTVGVPIRFHFFENFFAAHMIYVVGELIPGHGTIVRHESLGMLYTAPDFSTVIIHMTEWVDMAGGGRSVAPDSRFIVAPLANYESPLDTLHANNFYWFDDIGTMGYRHPN